MKKIVIVTMAIVLGLCMMNSAIAGSKVGSGAPPRDGSSGDHGGSSGYPVQIPD